jgi:hypothetical protein
MTTRRCTSPVVGGIVGAALPVGFVVLYSLAQGLVYDWQLYPVIAIVVGAVPVVCSAAGYAIGQRWKLADVIGFMAGMLGSWALLVGFLIWRFYGQP